MTVPGSHIQDGIAALLTGHVLGSLIQTMLCIAVVLAVALAIGFRPTATPIEWLAAAGMLAAIACKRAAHQGASGHQG